MAPDQPEHLKPENWEAFSRSPDFNPRFTDGLSPGNIPPRSPPQGPPRSSNSLDNTLAQSESHQDLPAPNCGPDPQTPENRDSDVSELGLDDSIERKAAPEDTGEPAGEFEHIGQVEPAVENVTKPSDEESDLGLPPIRTRRFRLVVDEDDEDDTLPNQTRRS